LRKPFLWERVNMRKRFLILRFVGDLAGLAGGRRWWRSRPKTVIAKAENDAT
jgi:hypothetical protein